MIEIKKLSGIMNKDDKEENILPSQHIDALNLRFYGGANGLTVQNVPGNTLISNTDLPTGDNECIGAFYDGVKQRIIWLNWNSADKHGIYQYDIKNKSVTPLIICFTNSQTDILGFDLDYPVSGINIIYTTDIDGDILTWVTRNKRPKCLNLLQAINNTYGVNWLEEYLDVAKEPPRIPIKCAYENDATVTVNNLRKKLFKFKYRFWYSDNEKSTWSILSEIPVPNNYSDPQVDTDQTKNCRIGCVIQTGDASVVKVEVAAAESLGNVFSNFFSTIILDKDELSIPDNDVYIWRFYNNEAYIFIDLDESILEFDRVPDKANTQELLNGNVLVYGGITEGLDPVVPNVTMDTNIEYPLSIDCNNIFSVTQYGLEGFKEGENIKFIVLGTIKFGQTFIAGVLVGATTYTITYTAVVGDTPALVLIGLSANAVGQGFTQVSIDSSTLVISRANQILLRDNIGTTEQTIAGTFVVTLSTKTVRINGGAVYLPLFTKGVQFYLYANAFNVDPFTVVSSSVSGSDLDIIVELVLSNETITTTLYFENPVNNSIPAYNSSSKENWGLVYFDEKGKNNGVTTSPAFNVNTRYLGLNKNLGTLLFYTPYITASISHRPPLWAKTYQWVRTANLTKQSSLFWVSDKTFKDQKFAYISIESINAYKRLNPNSIISYQFVSGDRIKFYVLYHPDGTPNVVYTAAHPHDYEIYDEIENPDINGAVRIGQYLKIILPELNGVGGTFDFSNGIDSNYDNYYIELYTPAKSAAEGLDVYYEFSEEYAIDNPGTNTAFHQGMLQNQSENLATPATFKFNKGDAWYRTRNIEIGNILNYDITSEFYKFPIYSGGGNYYDCIIGQKLKLQTYPSSDYIVADSVTLQVFSGIVSGGAYNQPGWTINVINNDYTFRVRGAINVNITGLTYVAPPVIFVMFYIVNALNVITQINAPFVSIAAGNLYPLNVDQFITIPAGCKLYVLIATNATNLSFNLVSGYLSFLEPKKNFQIGVIDENFSDFYESKVNSNGRSFTVHPDEKTNFFGTLLRWGLAYQQNTNINQLNRFNPTNFDEIDRSKGDIQRFKSRDRTLRIFQNRGVGQYGVYARFIQNNQGDSQLVTTNEILTKNNISYYAGEYGVGDQYTGLVSATRNDYFVDPVRGYQVRLADDGFTPISEIYKGQFYIRNLLTPFNKTYLRSNGATAKVLGCYAYFDEEYIAVLQGGTNNGNTILPQTFSFNERRNGYSSFFSFHPEWILSAEDVIYSWLNGQIYSHDNTTSYANFYGIQYDVSITLVFNLNLIEKKTWESITEVSNAIWSCPLIYGNVMSYGNTRQETMLGEYDFANLESNFHAAILRDQNSIGGIINGESMKGNYLCVKLLKQNASDLIYLSEVSMMYKDSPLTNK